LSWVILPMTLMSMPFVPKRGGPYEVTFMLPPLSILAGLATTELLKAMVKTFGGTFGHILMLGFVYPYGGDLLILGSVFIFWTLLECIRIHPYYIDYYSTFVKLINRAGKRFPVGWWGEGMSEAMVYIDQHAPPNTTVWVYGPKSSALYHSSRVNLRSSLEGETLYYWRAKAGVEVPLDEPSYTWRKGDLKFYFPYYRKGIYNDLDVSRLRAENVSYIVIYRWCTYDPGITFLDSSHYRIISELRNKYVPVHAVKVKGMEVCWVYKVEDLEGQG